MDGHYAIVMDLVWDSASAAKVALSIGQLVEVGSALALMANMVLGPCEMLLAPNLRGLAL